MAQVAEPVEAVIISGDRKGEIVRLRDGEIESFVSEQEIKMLNEALDGLIAAIERVSAEVRAMTKDLRKGMEEA